MYSTMDHWNVNSRVKACCHKLLDYTADFETASNVFLDKALCSAGLSVKLRRVIQTIISAASGCMIIIKPGGSRDVPASFAISRGVLQGDVISPAAFIARLMQIFIAHDSTAGGVTVGRTPKQVTITSLEYADDAGLAHENVDNASAPV